MTDLLFEVAKLALSAIAMGVSAWAWLYARRAQRIQKVAEQVDAAERRIAVIETAFHSLPPSHAWTALHTDIAGLRGDLRTSAAQIDGLGAGLKRVERQISLLMENELRGKSQS